MAEPIQAVEDYRGAFRRAARPGFDPHEAREFYHPLAGGPVPAARLRGRRLAEWLHGIRGSIEAAEALIHYAFGLGDDDETCVFFPGCSRENPDFGVIAAHRHGARRLEGAIRFRSTGSPWWEATDSTKGASSCTDTDR